MANPLEFILKLTDMLTPGMRQAARISNTTASQIQGQFDRIDRGGRRMAGSVNELRERLEAVNQVRFSTNLVSEFNTATRAAQRLERQIERLENRGRPAASAGGGGGGGLPLGKLGLAAAAVGVVGGVAVGTGKAISAGMEGGAQKVSFETMGGKKEGGKLYDDITKFSQESIFGKELYQNAQTMLAFGASTQTVLPDLKMLGDVSMGNKEKLGSLTLAYSQVRSAQKLTGQDLLQFINTGFNPLNEISKQTGESMSSLRAKMEAGQISFDMVQKAFQSATSEGGKFYNMTNAIAETPSGKFEAFKGQLEGIALSFGEKLMPSISKLLDAVAPLADSLGNMLVPAFSFLIDNIVPPLVAGLNMLKGMFDSSGGTAMTVAQQLMSMGKELYSALVPVFKVIAPMLGEILGVIWAILPPLVHFTSIFISALVPVFKELQPLIMYIVRLVGALLVQVGAFAAHLMQSLSPALTKIAHMLGVILPPVLSILAMLFGKVLDVVLWLIDKIMWVLNPVIDLISWIFDKISIALDWLADTLTDKSTTDAYAAAGAAAGTAYSGAFKDALKPQNIMALLMPWQAVTPAAMVKGRPLIATDKWTDPGTSGTGGSSAGSSSIADSADKINSGGQRSITINIGKQIETLVQNIAGGSQDVADEIDRAVREGIARAVRSINGVAVN